MATVCGGTLAMMDAGVPIKEPVAGIAMGLIKEGEAVMVLSDILGLEDHLGDMDFKVCGTVNGVTALQMDIKIGGITTALLQRALEQARAGRLHILSHMAKALPGTRPNLSPFAPRSQTKKPSPSLWCSQTASVSPVTGQPSPATSPIVRRSKRRIALPPCVLT